MLKLIITTNDISHEYELTNNLSKDLIKDANNIILQDSNKTMLLNLASRSNNLFPQIIDMIISKDLQSVDQLKIYFDEININQKSNKSILNELQVLLEKSSFTYEIIGTIETEAGNEDNSDGSTFLNNSNLENSQNHDLINRSQLDFQDNSLTKIVTENSNNQSNEQIEDVNTETIDPIDPILGKIVEITGISEDTGISSNDYITNDNTLKINGTSDAADGSNIIVTIDGVSLRTTVTGGTWEVSNEGVTLSDAVHTVTVQLVDAADNVASSDTQDVVVDTSGVTVPTHPTNPTNPLAGKVVEITGISDDTGISSNDYITNDNTLKINGTSDADDGSNIKVTIDGITLITTISSGTWEVSNESNTLNDGVHTVTAELINSSNNVISTDNLDITINTSSIITPIITNVIDINSDLSEIIMTGEGEKVGNIIKLYDNSNTLVGTTVVLSDGTWSIDLTSISQNFNHLIKAVEVDTAGNESLPSPATAVYINTIGQYLTLTGEEDYYFNGHYTAILYNNNDDDNNFLVFDAGGGWHSLDFRGNVSSINIDLAGDTITIGDDIVEIRNLDLIIGTNYDDTIIANDEGNVITAWEGNDTIYGGAGIDSIRGDAGTDILYGGSGDDSINGGDNSDTIIGGKGDDNIWGGTNNIDTGVDTAVYTGTFSEYTFLSAFLYDYFYITDTVADRDGEDFIHLVEYLQFSDKTVSTAVIDNPIITLVSSSDSGSDQSDNISNISAPTIHISLPTNIEDNYKILIYSDSSEIISYTITASDITNTFVNITLPSFTSDNTYSIEATFVNELGFEGEVSASPISFTLDTAEDDISLSQNSSIDNQIDVNNLESTSTWEYSLDSGSTWTVGVGSSFALLADTVYSENSIQVKTTDIAGNEYTEILTTSTTTSTPLVLDLDGDGVETISKENGVLFDIDADGDKDLTAWASSDDGLLIRDINNDGIINDASELFGEETVKEDGTTALDGFDALSELDSNTDSIINSEDEAYNELQVWQDKNSDGITDEKELLSLKEAGISEISLDAIEINKVDNGNIIGLESSYTDEECNRSEISDVWFAYEVNKENESISLEDVKNSTLDLGNQEKDLVEINFNNLVDVLDENNELIILGDDQDSLILEGGVKTQQNQDARWELKDSKEDDEGTIYNIYESQNGDSCIKLLIENTIDVSDI